jgi:Kelch motif
MIVARLSSPEATATLLRTGKVLVVGGCGACNVGELYDPRTGRWSGAGDGDYAIYIGYDADNALVCLTTDVALLWHNVGQSSR